MPISSPRPSGSGTGGGLRAGRVGTPVARQARSQGPGFVDIGRLLSANRAGAQRMADSLQSTVRDAGEAAKKDIADAETKFGQGVAAGTLGYNPGVATSQEAAAQGQKSFSGPKTWEEAGVNTGDLAQKAASAQDKAANLSTDYGRAALLRQQVTGPYSAGMSGLDAALSGAAGGAALRQTSEAYSGLSQRLIDARGGAGAKVEQATKDSEANAARYREQVPLLQQQEAKAAKEAEVAAERERRRLEDERRRNAGSSIMYDRNGNVVRP